MMMEKMKKLYMIENRKDQRDRKMKSRASLKTKKRYHRESVAAL